MSARFVEPVFREQAERIRRWVDETLAALDVEMDVAVHVHPRHAVKHKAANVIAWADSLGVHVFEDALDLPDDRLQLTTVEETAHYWHGRAHPRVAASPLHAELFAHWLVAHVTRAAMVPTHMPPDPDPYVLGCYAGCALAGFDDATEALKAAGRAR